MIQYNSYSTIIILITLKKIQYGYFSFSDISENKWTDIARISIIAELLALITQESLDMIDADFLLCSTVSWIQTLDESKTMFKTHPSKVRTYLISHFTMAAFGDFCPKRVTNQKQ